MLRQIRGALGSAVFLVAPASAATVVATFESGLDGFTGDGAALSLQSTGGISGDFLETLDNKGGWGSLQWGSQFFGAFEVGGEIGFDATLLYANGGDTVPFGEITLSGGGLSATADAVIGGIPPLGQWQSYSLSLDATTWGMSDTDFATLLSSITKISMVVESTYGVNERLGFDNFKVSSVEAPLPAAAFLFLSALAGFFVRNRAN